MSPRQSRSLTAAFAFAVALSTGAIAAPSFAQTQSTASDSNAECLGADKSDVSIETCLTSKAAKVQQTVADKADELHAAIDGLDDADARVKAGTALDQAQASWRSYMDATCSLEGEIASATGSADASYAEDACEIRYSKARADYLGSLSARFASGEN